MDGTKRAGLADLLGWFNGIAAADVDNDGDMDYAVSNFGLNTKYHATPEKPVMLHYGDFEGDGQMHLVEAEYEDETLFPVRGRSCSTNAMPSLGKKFTTFHDFALAPLAEIYPAERIEKSHTFVCNTLESGLLINDGQGRFTFRPLPRIAQIAPGFGVALADVNADGNVDLCLAQNFFTPQLETGRMSGGVSLLLLGDGTGDFEPVWPNRSGIVVGGDAKSLSVVDLNGDNRPDFVFGINDDRTIAFENTAPADATRRPVAIRLEGKPGNTPAIGARVTAEADGAEQLIGEIQAGGGYLSQQPSVLFYSAKKEAATMINVRWPDGTTTEHELSASGDGPIIIAQP